MARLWPMALLLLVLCGLTPLHLVTAQAGSVARKAPEARPAPAPLAEHFDNAGISDDADASAADLDGTGRSLSAAALRRAGWGPGQRLTVHRTRLTWPDTVPGEPDNAVADGQEVRVSGRGDALTLLVAATGGTATGSGRIVYADGTSDTYTLTVPDWVTGPHPTKAVALPYANSPQGRIERPVLLYARTVPADPARDVARVELPRVADDAARIHVFALGLRAPTSRWTGTWSTSTSGYTAVGPWEDQTLRLAVRSTTGGLGARVRLDNTFAAEPVAIGRVTIALRRHGAEAAHTPVPLTFDGAPGTRIPAGGQVLSDPAMFPVPAGGDLLVSIHLPEAVTAAPVHTAVTGTNYVTAPGSGDATAAAGADPFTGTIATWPFLTGIDVLGGPGSVVALGDSITDGVGSTPNANRRWPDVFSERLRSQSSVPHYGVLNQGISANRIVTDRYSGDGVSTDTGGVSAPHRLERDVLAQTSAHTVIVFEGVNDVRHTGTTPQQVTAGLAEIAARTRAHGKRVLVATVAPCGGFRDCTDEVDAKRREVNAFIRANGRAGGLFDGVLDFDAVLRDPSAPERLLPAYDSGDHLHPGDAGLRAIAESIDLELLRAPA
ncbi:G-D-S-L family lipolytic protein [Nocardiopsis gilva YIM 90087]|uniref:G-D-S-L family lipolytic protein n=1 Tax=Nocardiopsis gilva YIM 90087 TaxID=1235441 RepID=A0A223S9E0_9ACTN|nr:SGNH/GDSL hydrolase family protein [Nocardiopsis gilva]ASU84723.1 G-D-S-L family lipolytic protein [Nocardiopsis gilva YIM 90087]